MYLRLFMFFIISFLFSGCDGSVKIKMAHDKNQGIYSDRIVFGSSLALKGHAGYLGRQMLHGALACIKEANSLGGIHGRRIDLVTYDDSYDPAKCLANTQKLIIEDKVFALFGYVGTPTTVKVLPMIEDARIPLVGMFTGANDLRFPFNKYLINIRPSYYQETSNAVRHIVADLQFDKIAVFYQYDAYGFDGLTGAEMALRHYGLAPVGRGSYVRGKFDVDDGVQKIAASGAEVVFLVGTAEPCAEFIKKSAEIGFKPVYYIVSFAGAEEFIRILQGMNAKVLMSQVVPSLYAKYGNELEGAEYIKLLEKYYPDEAPSLVGLEGFFNAKVLIEGLQRSGRYITRAKFLDSLESLRDYHVAPGLAVSFGREDHQGLDNIYFTRLDGRQFVPVSNWDKVRGLFK